MAKFNSTKFTHFKKKYNIMKLLTKFTKPICCRIGHKIYSLPLELYGYLLVLILPINWNALVSADANLGLFEVAFGFQ
jgi:hypothetical protein